MSKLNALIAGSTGYIGIQLVKLLIKHPNINIKYLCGNTSIGKSISYFDKKMKNGFGIVIDDCIAGIFAAAGATLITFLLV